MRRLLRRLRRRRAGRAPVILMYHRVATPARDPWALSVSPERFRDHLAALRAHRTPMSMTALVDALDGDTAPDDAVAVTFDDGYLDNLIVAKPMLEAGGIPATVYLATGSIGGARPFWWDELESILSGSAAMRFDAVIGGKRVRVDVPEGPVSDPPGWRFAHGARTARQRAYVRLWTRLRNTAPDERTRVIDSLRRRAGPSRHEEGDLPMSEEAVTQLVSALVDVGAHGVTHTAMTTLSPDVRRSEIVESGREATRLSGRLANGFAYPHGDHDRRTREIVREAGYRHACSTFAAAIDPARYDCFALPRLMVEDWCARELIGRVEALRS